MTKVEVSHWPLTNTCQPLKKRTTEAAEREESASPLLPPRPESELADSESVRTEDKTVVCEEWLKRRAVRQHLAVDTLSLESGVEASRSEADSPPSEKTADRGHLSETL